MKPPSRSIPPVMLLIWSAAASAAAPEWLRTLVPSALPSYPAKTDADILLDERVITVKDSGEIKTTRRLAVKICGGGQNATACLAYFDNDTRPTFLKAWSFPLGRI